jgi:hypothetical protein
MVCRHFFPALRQLRVADAMIEATPIRSLPPLGGSMFIWILGFANNRLTIADFRDVGLLGV